MPCHHASGLRPQPQLPQARPSTTEHAEDEHTSTGTETNLHSHRSINTIAAPPCRRPKTAALRCHRSSPQSREGTPALSAPSSRCKPQRRHSSTPECQHRQNRRSVVRSAAVGPSTAPNTLSRESEGAAPPPCPGPLPRLVCAGERARRCPAATRSGAPSRAETARHATRRPLRRRPPSGLCPSASPCGSRGVRKERGVGAAATRLSPVPPHGSDASDFSRSACYVVSNHIVINHKKVGD